MAKDSEKKPPQELDKTGEFFSIGAPLHAVRPGYVRRPADDLLYDTLVAGNCAYVIAPDRSGKSSLIASTAARLQNNGFKVAMLDLAEISERDGGADAGRWYYSIAYRLLRQLRLKTNLQTWWQDNSILSNRQRLVEFYIQVVLQNVPERIVVFIDEVQYVAELPFAEHLLASIRAAHNSRTTDPEFNRLGFVMIGECDPESLVSDPHFSPISIATEVRLTDFSRADLEIFAAELGLSPADAGRALDRIYHWTSGQPYLSQKLARAVAREGLDGDMQEGVDRLALMQLAGRAAISSEPHLSHLHRAVVNDTANVEAMLTTYGQIHKGITVSFDPESRRHRRLLAIGLVVIDDDGTFRIRNRVYASVFTARWANENLPLRWRSIAIAALLIVAVTAVPFSYTQLLPKPYLHIMSDPVYDLTAISDAYKNLRSFPGHVEAADRMYRAALEERADKTVETGEIREISNYAAMLPDGIELAERLQSEFWDRKAQAAMRNERRDEALIASLEALAVTTQERRRRAASLIGDDFAELLATIPVRDADGLVFNADNTQLTYYRGAKISQWTAEGSGVTGRDPWDMSALEITPLVRRVIVDREGSTSRIGLTINVSHARLDDIRVKLIAPSGRTAELTFTQPSSAANEEIRIARSQLASLVGEALNGTWSLSLRDEANGVSGHLISWNLSLNSQVVVESFDRGLDIPDPLERASENLWFSADGRHAIARASQSDSARLWDLGYARAVGNFAVSARERVLGLHDNAAFLVTMTQNTVNLWRSADGRRHLTFDVGASLLDSVMSADGQFLLISRQSDPDTLFEVWSLASGDIVAELSVAGVPALVSIDASATHLAVADYDRAVRIWNIRTGQLRAQLDLRSQPSDISLSATGATLGVVLGDQGVALWNTDRTDAPVFQGTGSGEWHMAFSPSGARFIAGNLRDGLQTYRSDDGTPTGVLLDPGLRPGVKKIFAFNRDENKVITAGSGDKARFWTMPAVAAAGGQGRVTGNSASASYWRDSGTVVAAISPGGERLAFGDRSGHVHIEQVGATAAGAQLDVEEISFLGHRDGVRSLIFSPDGALVASAGEDGTIRVWDAHSGLPRPFYGRASVTTIRHMAFSPSASQLAVLGGQRVWLMNSETGNELASIELGEVHADLAFPDDNQLYLGGASGTLRSLYADRTGNWHLRNVWQGPQAIQHLQIALHRQQVVLVDALNQARLLDPASGRVGTEILQLPAAVNEVAFSPNESRVLFRTGRWIHRAVVAPIGLIWTDSIRAPKALNGSRMAFERSNTQAGKPADGMSGDRVLILARDTGLTELTESSFSFDEGPALFGNKSSLLGEWNEKLTGPVSNDFVREGF